MASFLTTRFLLTTLFAGVAGVFLASASVPVSAEVSDPASDQADAFTVDDLTIYPSGAAVIADNRRIELKSGLNTIAWPTPGTIALDTFWLAGDAVEMERIKSTASDQQSGDPLARRVGKPVVLLRPASDDDESSASNKKRGVLTAVAGDVAYIAAGGQILRVTPASPSQIRWPASAGSSRYSSEGSGQPKIELVVDAKRSARAKLQATYQLQGLTWYAATTGRYDRAAAHLIFHTVAVVKNTTGAPIRARHAGLIAGQTNRAGKGGVRPVALAASRQSSSTASEPKPVGHGYRYQIDGGLALAANQTGAFTIIDRTQIRATRKLILENRFRDQYSGADRRHARVLLTFDNPDEAPLPAGVFRVYSADQPATLLGADRVGNVAPGGTVTLNLGRSFDVTASHRVVTATQTKDAYKRTIVVEIRNAGDKPVQVEVREHLPDHAEIVETSQPVARQTVGEARWKVRVESDGDAALRYTVRWPRAS